MSGLGRMLACSDWPWWPTVIVVLLCAGSAAADCVAVTAGLDTSTWTTSRIVFGGSAIGQTFLAVDTVITRITVWRPPNNRDDVGAHLYITKADSSRTPPPPDLRYILQDGPTVHVFDSEPSGQLIEMRFNMDPPLVLPGRGIYAFFLQAENCYNGALWAVIANGANAYPHGAHWVTRRVSSPCYLGAVVGSEDSIDLIFEIEYCKTTTTPARRRSWGELKMIYR